jgi:hypothetical protein
MTLGEARDRAAAGDPEAQRQLDGFAAEISEALLPLLGPDSPPRLPNPIGDLLEAEERARADRAAVENAERRAATRRERMMLRLTAMSCIAGVVAVAVAILK